MLKREITYETFDGEEATDVFYFNISKPELLELEVDVDGGMAKMLQNIIDTRDNKAILSTFKDLVLLAYGIKSDDGKRFVKSDELREQFSQTAAYQSLFMELATDDNAAVVFLKGCLPKDLSEAVDVVKEDILPPIAPTTDTPIVDGPTN